MNVGSNGKFEMTGGTITGNTTGDRDCKGGGVYMDGGTFTMSGSASITGNTGKRGIGGGVNVGNNGKFEMTGGTIGGNDARGGGGVFVDGGAVFTMNDGSIEKNTANGNGGGVNVGDNGKFEMTGGTIDDNNANHGGGVCMVGREFTMSNDAKIANNKATQKGGGVHVAGGTFEMNGGTIEKNTANGNGGGVDMSGGTFTVSGSAKVTDNKKNSVLNNVYLPGGKTIAIGDTLENGANIGVTTASEPTEGAKVQFAIDANKDLDYTTIFTPDVRDKGYEVTKDGDCLYLSTHQHSWSYTANGATITAKCSKSGCPASDGGSVTINAPTANLEYDKTPKEATLTASSDWKGDAADSIEVKYTVWNGTAYESTSAPTDAGEYTASITLTGADGKPATASVTYEITKATPQASDFLITPPNNLVYDGNAKTATVTTQSGINGMGAVTVKYFKGGAETEPKDAGDYTVKVSVAEGGTNYNAATDLTADNWKFTIAPKPLTSEGITAADIASQTYTGSAITPEPEVKYGEIKLEKDKDYTVTYESNTNAGTATAKITGQGNYTGEVNKTFTINPRALENDMITAIAAQVYTGKAITPEPEVKYGEIKLEKDKDYTVSYASNTAVGTATVTVTAVENGNYDGSATANFTIGTKPITAEMITISGTYTYTGSAITPTVAVKYGGVTLTEGTDYTVGLSNNTNAGEATVKITGTGNYSDEASKDFTIGAKTLTSEGITAADIASQTYTGSAITPEPEVKYGEIKLEKDKDYTVTYESNTNAGTATAKITGQGNYTGEVSKTFTINPRALENGMIAAIDAQVYTGEAITPEPEVKYGEIKLEKDKDYTVSYASNTAVGTATVTVTAVENGNYDGSATANFTIGTKPITAEMITISGTYTYTGSAITPTVAVKYGGVTLTEGTDYTVGLSNNTNAGEATVKITGTGNYSDEASKDFTIGAKTLTSEGITAADIASQTYTGSAITPEPEVKYGEIKLEKDKDYTVTYESNTNAGTATAKITGQGNYTGEVNKTFTINPRALENAQVVVRGGLFTYDGTAKVPTVTVKLGEKELSADTDYTLSYSNSNGGDGNLTNAGTVTVTATGKGNYTATATGTFTINKAQPNYTPPTGLTATYGDTLKDVPLTDGWAWNDLNTSVGNVGENTFPATYNKDSSGNYNPVQQNLTVKVSPASYKITLTGQADSPTQITLNEAVVEPGNIGAAVSYGMNTTNTAPSKWQAEKVFSGLTADTTYYFFAKVGATTNYAETISTGVAITTPEKEVSSISIQTQPTTLAYTSGETLDLSGLSVQVSYNDSTSETIGWDSGKLTATPANGTPLTAAAHNGRAVTISYGGKTTDTNTLTVDKRAQAALSITGKPTTVYNGDTFTLTTTGGSGTGTVTWEIISGPATVDANGKVTVTGTGSIEVKATKAADADYNEATATLSLTATTKPSGGYSYYTIKATAGAGGSISPSGNVSVREGRDQTFTITPDKGYAVANVKIDGKSIGAVKSYTFENVRRTHTIEVIFMKANGNPQTGVFVDVATGSYYEDAVDWAVEKGITNGVSSNMFAPDDPCTRAQIVTFLWRAAGSPAPKSMSSFTDVPADAFYAKAVAWAVENGITSGTGEGKFSPNAICTRAQSVTFLYRASGSPAVSGSAEFSDVSTTAFYADAVAWATKKGITTGIGGGLFGSDNDCTRSQIVTFLWRCKK